MPDDRKADRYAMRADQKGWTIFEIWSGKPALVAQAPQTGLSEADAKHTLALLNRNAKRGDASMRKP